MDPAMETTVTGRTRGTLKALVAWIAIAALLALVAWLAAERNARSWYLVPSEGRLVVMRGLMLPVGRAAFTTSDPVLAQAYAPLVPPPGKPLPAERTFDERGLLDQAIYDLVAGWARDDIAAGDPARLERGLGYLARAERLPGISPAQREDLAALRAESSYQEGIRLLSRGVDELRQASDRLRRAASSRSPHAADAGRLLRDLEPVLDAAAAAAGRAEPRPQQPPPAPPPGPAPTSANEAEAPRPSSDVR
jgi:hypothetical protein